MIDVIVELEERLAQAWVTRDRAFIESRHRAGMDRDRHLRTGPHPPAGARRDVCVDERQITA